MWDGRGVIIGRMSRLRRLALFDRFFFITRRVHRLWREANESEFSRPAEALRERGDAHQFMLTKSRRVSKSETLRFAIMIPASIVLANLFGFITGEWRLASKSSVRALSVGLVVLIVTVLDTRLRKAYGFILQSVACR